MSLYFFASEVHGLKRKSNITKYYSYILGLRKELLMS